MIKISHFAVCIPQILQPQFTAGITWHPPITTGGETPTTANFRSIGDAGAFELILKEAPYEQLKPLCKFIRVVRRTPRLLQQVINLGWRKAKPGEVVESKVLKGIGANLCFCTLRWLSFTIGAWNQLWRNLCFNNVEKNFAQVGRAANIIG